MGKWHTSDSIHRVKVLWIPKSDFRTTQKRVSFSCFCRQYTRELVQQNKWRKERHMGYFMKSLRWWFVLHTKNAITFDILQTFGCGWKMTKMFLKQTKSSTKLGLSLSISRKQYVQILTAFERLKFIDYLSFCGSLLVYIRIICLYLISTENTQTQTTNVQMIIIICIFVRLRLISTVSILKSTVTQTKKTRVLKQSCLSVVTLVDTFFFVLIIIWWKNRIKM